MIHPATSWVLICRGCVLCPDTPTAICMRPRWLQWQRQLASNVPVTHAYPQLSRGSFFLFVHGEDSSVLLKAEEAFLIGGGKKSCRLFTYVMKQLWPEWLAKRAENSLWIALWILDTELQGFETFPKILFSSQKNICFYFLKGTPGKNA